MSLVQTAAASPYSLLLARGYEFLGIVERHRRYHRPENFFPHDLHIFPSIHQNSGLHEIAFVAFRWPPERAFAPSEKPASRYPQTRFNCSSKPAVPCSSQDRAPIPR